MTPTIKEVKTIIQNGEIEIQPIWNGVDRPTSFSWMVKNTPSNKKLAERLKTAILAGSVLTNPSIRTDIYGATYVSCDKHVLGRKMNADLNRLGF